MFLVAYFLAELATRKLSRYWIEKLSFIGTYLGSIIGIGSVTEANFISLGGYPPVILIWKLGPQIGVGLLLFGFILQMNAHEMSQVDLLKKNKKSKK